MSREERRRKGGRHVPQPRSPRGSELGCGQLRVIRGGRAGKGPLAEAPELSARRVSPPAAVRRRRRVATAAMLVIAIGLITYILLGPVTRLVESRRNLARAEAQLAEESSRTRVLEERRAWDLTDRFIELEARKMGYVKPGEIPIIVLDHLEKGDSKVDAPEGASP